MQPQDWYSVRSLFRLDQTRGGEQQRAFEERVVLFRASSPEDALEKGEAEAKRYASDHPPTKMLEHIVVFLIQENELCEGEEVWSCIRHLEIDDNEFIRRFCEGEFVTLSSGPTDRSTHS